MSGRKRFACSYDYFGSKWGFDIYATNGDDANRRLAAIAACGRVDGEVTGIIPFRPGLFARIQAAYKVLIGVW